MWWLAVFLVLFLWHEGDEYRVLIPWLASNQQRLPGRLARMRMTHRQFTVIAAQQFVLIILVAWLAPPLWAKAMVAAYLVHLLLHCAQLVFTYLRGFFLPLYSPVLQLPLVAGLLWFMEPPVGGSLFVFAGASAVLVATLFVNLGLMHLLVSHLLPEQHLRV